MEAQYRALPQSPDLAHDISIPSAIEDVDESILDDDLAPSSAPVDSRILWIHFMLGSAVLLPWNVMITAEPYFLSRLRNSPIRSTFASYLATTFTLSNFIFLAHATVTSKKVPSAQRTRWSMLCLALLTCLLTLSTFIHLPEGVFATFTIMAGIALAATGSYLQTSVIAVASLFGPTAIQSLISGQAVVAVVLSAVQLIGAAGSLHSSQAGPTDGVAETRSARLFFGISMTFLLACGAANAWMTRLPSFRAVIPNDEPWVLPRRLSISADPRSPRSPMLGGPLASVPDPKAIWDRILSVARRNIIYELAVAYVFIITLSVFPAITISIAPTNPAIHPLFFSSLHFLVFNIGDWFGRYLCSFPRLLVWRARRLLVLSLARTLLIPLFLACNLHRDASSPSTPPIINSDVLYMLLLFAFGLSSGYVSSMCLMAAPSLEHNPRLKGRKEDVDLAAPIASFCVVGGLVLGSILSFTVRAIVCACNPFLAE
ncbi:nucleoside transporter-domain-containing protein [Russula ochroleuca]|jgi:equilibrative nucleoside transporter 1/2/3|uniref:Nucleoside transporter-domain-containing protein n=1 Tax=Russula ochroleuca TaxID=152965 RepID=A0A9P5N378_9AGAM|nr:nucleoside transporter-domain-containing protein [Russula ochroleuca]